MAATIRKRTTGKLDKFGNPVISYQVRWREPVRDEFGAPTGTFKQTSETFPTERKAKAHLRKVEDQLESAAGVDPSSQKAKANRPLGKYAKQYLESLAGTIDDSTIAGYENIYRTHIASVFGSKPVASMTTADVTAFRAQLLAPHHRRSFVTRGKPQPKPHPSTRVVTRSPATVKQIVGTLKRILDTAQDDQAIQSNPVVSGRRRTTKRRATGETPFSHHPLTANQVASVADWIANTKGNQVYALAVLFAAHTGVRAAELQGLQVQDLTLSDISGTVGAIRVARTAKRETGRWTYGTPKSDASTNRTVPLAPWLADELRDYLTTVHPFAGRHLHAPLFPGRLSRSSFDWAHPVVADNLYDNYLQPATKALGLGAVRFHDLRHTFATMNLSAGEHYMQVSKWLGHSSFVLTLTTYADYIREDVLAVPKVGRGTVTPATDNVVTMQRTAT
ncbi:integrase [Mycobacterium sp. 852002-51971_SCH5477799-a]|uniref:tyrosine-type recombinase/integrase n=1 Tax=Mycobacterium sp. 852002-51971_SCH5477799-a TaxID=1834106 RepID=UPI0007FB9E40|nr:site-specific integrase [Mycobacterium sp. 852002-51971_SCH5477799-a]OBF69618.1 integrase [Mycobacterium sp. 852002-51971_SCH5477799-a]